MRPGAGHNKFAGVARPIPRAVKWPSGCSSLGDCYIPGTVLGKGLGSLGGAGRVRESFSVQAMSAGLLSAFVGFASSFFIILQGLTAVGASQAEAASGLIALSVAMGLGGIYLSLKTKLPISVAWSTPGAALLATTGALEGGFAAAVGAFLATAVLIILAGLWKPLGRWVAAIPKPLANAMLAGVLLTFCLAPVHALAEAPAFALPIVAAWALVWKLNRLYAVPAALLVTAGIVIWATDLSVLEGVSLWPAVTWVAPAFSIPAMIGIALPLFVVTMAAQNIPGIAVLNANNYRPSPGPLFASTGVFSLAAAPFGGHAVNLAANTAAICAGPAINSAPGRSELWSCPSPPMPRPRRWRAGWRPGVDWLRSAGRVAAERRRRS